MPPRLRQTDEEARQRLRSVAGTDLPRLRQRASTHTTAARSGRSLRAPGGPGPIRPHRRRCRASPGMATRRPGAGFEHIYLHNVGRNQQEFIEVFGERVPRVKVSSNWFSTALVMSSAMVRSPQPPVCPWSLRDMLVARETKTLVCAYRISASVPHILVGADARPVMLAQREHLAFRRVLDLPVSPSRLSRPRPPIPTPRRGSRSRASRG